jgi:endo-1,4-beta-xylanase
MSNYLKIIISAALFTAIVGTGCRKANDNAFVMKADTAMTLKSAAQYLLGCGIEYDSMMNKSNYANTVLSQFNSVTFGYSMKHGAIVRNDGSDDFTQADNLVSMCTQAGLGIYGHTLCWYQNNNGNYLRALLAQPSSMTAPNPNIVLNGTFEGGTGNNFSNWSVWNGGSSVTAGTGAGEMYEGGRSLKATVAVNGNPWDVQTTSDLFNTVKATVYKVRFWAKEAAAGGKIRISTRGDGSAEYSPDFMLTTSWAPYEWKMTADGVGTGILFDEGYTTNTYYVDSVSVTLASATGGVASAAELHTRIDTALHNFINAMVGHYKNNVHAWDVVNEIFQDNGQYRSDPSSQSDVFPWWTYLGGGDSVIMKAFAYAHAADPTALLFINDYNQESSTAKLDSMVSVVTRLKKLGVPIDGVGLQFHISVNTPNTGIDNALLQLAATGLKVRISELDVKLNPGMLVNFVATNALYAQQADKYKYVVESFYRNVPSAQRYGITVWGVTDKDSWLNTGQIIDYPLLWDGHFDKKSAYYQFLTGLQLK